MNIGDRIRPARNHGGHYWTVTGFRDGKPRIRCSDTGLTASIDLAEVERAYRIERFNPGLAGLERKGKFWVRVDRPGYWDRQRGKK